MAAEHHALRRAIRPRQCHQQIADRVHPGLEPRGVRRGADDRMCLRLARAIGLARDADTVVGRRAQFVEQAFGQGGVGREVRQHATASLRTGWFQMDRTSPPSMRRMLPVM
jgi:hypothetical protein